MELPFRGCFGRGILPPLEILESCLVSCRQTSVDLTYRLYTDIDVVLNRFSLQIGHQSRLQDL
jgi:hypothetical protein